MDRRGKIGRKGLSLGVKTVDCEFSSRFWELELESYELVEI
jgi:hypothetical protein